MNTIKKGSFALIFLALLWIGAARWLVTHDHAFTAEKLLQTDASELTDTTVTPHCALPLGSEHSVLWCATFQLAWNEACDLVGENLHFRGDEPPMVEVLNRRSFTRQYIDEQSFVAVAGFVKDDVFGRIRRELDTTFKGQATPRYIPSRDLAPRPQDIVAYSYLFKNLEFAIPFERISEPLIFGNVKVPCFGIGEEFKDRHEAMLEQLNILDYQNENDFIVELKTKGEKDQLILAKVQPAETLDETLRSVQDRIAVATPEQPVTGDVLKVPKINFDITREYYELEGRYLLVKNPQIATDLMVTSALQNIRFQLDEKGVRLKSESHITFGCAATAPSLPPRHIMIFDDPFLLILRRTDAELPYFALWIADPEILVKNVES